MKSTMQRQADEIERLRSERFRLREGAWVLLVILAVMSAKYWGLVP